MSSKVVPHEMMMAINLPLEVHKFSSWHLRPYLTDDVSIEFTDTNPITFSSFYFCWFSVNNDFEKIKDIFCRLYTCIYESNPCKVLGLFYDTKLPEYIMLCWVTGSDH